MVLLACFIGPQGFTRAVNEMKRLCVVWGEPNIIRGVKISPCHPVQALAEFGGRIPEEYAEKNFLRVYFFYYVPTL